jgi:polysaccharide deacetylase family protein (PEP-CTERM system associated)
MHCLTFDIEEHFQVSAFESPERRGEWSELESRVERNTHKILELLVSREVKATFFVLGWIAERHCGLVRAIVKEGHEIASHGYDHKMISSQSQEEFREDIRKTKGLLEDMSGTAILGYRAPSFSITTDTLWALAILAEEGYIYDSSIFPIMHDRYGIPGAKPVFHLLTTNAGPLWEVPPATASIVGIRIPIAGGGYFRLYPYALVRYFLKKGEDEGQTHVMYIHPWELDPEQPRMKGSLFSRFRHYVNLHKTHQKLSSLMEDFDFGPISSVLDELTSGSQ